MLPDVKPLWDFLVLHRPAKLVGVWVPPASRHNFRIATAAVEIVFFLAAIAGYIKYDGDRYKAYTDSVRSSPIVGLWELDPASKMPVTVGGVPWHSISIDSLTRGMARSTDGMLWRMYLTYNESAHTLGMVSRGGGHPVQYTWQVPDPNHLVLQTAGNTLTFNRVPTPAQYPVLSRGFHLVNEWGYER